ncbi:response regulator receiver domain [Pseudomonas tolaasii]|uniref:response regulator receiver domain n=1 Tax=Pseudomonas tolaasii TaxID=29442 RepID=UPI001C603E6C|nr:response regulator receiver domain [Pseudomonas tolaasii]MBW4795533.1 hypothetical protein [Pseudomonas tolaasii]
MTEVAVMISQSMDDAVNAAAFSYRDLINEAFIVPIRSAVVVDDEFPTLDEFLNDVEAAGRKKHADRARDIIGFCRNRTPYPWIVDVHDGKNIPIDTEVRSATHFDHTDLLVLDYHLNGDAGGGDRAISLLRTLSGNEHFNLVIVYTNNDVSETVREIGLSLSSVVSFESLFPEPKSQHIPNVLLEWEETEPNILSELLSSIDRLALVKVLARGVAGLNQFEELSDFRLILDIIASAPVKFNPKDMVKYILREKFKSIKEELSLRDFGSVEIDEVLSGDGQSVNWIRVDSLFVTVIKKSAVSPDQFAERLIDAIEGWDPSPHRLILSRMRGEIGKRGIIVEQEVLKNPYLQVAWLKDIFGRESAELRTNVRRNVSRHWEGLGSKIEPGVLNYAEKVGKYFLENKIEVSRYSHPDIIADLKKTALHVNSYVCSKPVEGHHLSTGHVFSVADEYWICLTPACDLEPRAEIAGSNRHLGSWMPFKAAQIVPMKDAQSALENATRGNHLFLSIRGGDEPVAFTFTPDPGGEQSVTPTLRWQQFYASNQGRFLDGAAGLKFARSLANKDGLEFVEQQGEVVAHVRYEYALHLLHRLGNHLSRVGLDFVRP